MRNNVVMLLDDNDTDNYISKRIIGMAGFSTDILIETCGMQALEYLNNNKSTTEKIPNFLFLDLHMPGMNGFFFLTKFQRLDKEIKNRCNIVILTSSTNSADLDRLKKFDNVIEQFTKPLTIIRLNQLKCKFYNNNIDQGMHGKN